MSAENVAATLRVSSEDELRRIRILRYAVGSSLAMAVAMGFGWQLSFLTPVLSLSFLGTPAPRPKLKGGIAFIAVVAVACLAGMMLSRFVLPYPLVFIPFTGYLLFRLFYAKTGGVSPLLIMWMLIALLVIPMLAMLAPALAGLVAAGIVVGATVTIGVVWLTYGIFPDPVGAAQEAAPVKPAAVAMPGERLQGAVLSTSVLFPVFVLFYMFQWADSILILIFVAILAQQPSFATNFKAGVALIVGNVIGGAAAIVFYELLVVVPEFWFLLVLTLLAGLVFGTRVFSGKPTAPLCGMAFSTLLLVIGSTTSGEGEAGSKVYSRVMQMLAAVVYVVAAFGLIERFKRAREA